MMISNLSDNWDKILKRKEYFQTADESAKEESSGQNLDFN